MYLGRHVVWRSASTLRPRASRVLASTSTPWQIAPTGRPSVQNRATCSCSAREPRYWRIPGAWPPGSNKPSKAARSRSVQAAVAANAGSASRSAYQLFASGSAPSLPNSTPASNLGSARGTVPALSVAKATWWPAERRICQGTATSVTSKSRSGTGISTRTSRLSPRSVRCGTHHWSLTTGGIPCALRSRPRHRTRPGRTCWPSGRRLTTSRYSSQAGSSIISIRSSATPPGRAWRDGRCSPRWRRRPGGCGSARWSRASTTGIRPSWPIWLRPSISFPAVGWICIGGSGERRTLRTTALYAQHWNFVGGSPDEFARKRDVLHAHCRDVGRDPAEITLSSHVRLNADHDFAATAGQVSALAAEGLELAIVYLLPPLRPAVLTPLAAALAPLA